MRSSVRPSIRFSLRDSISALNLSTLIRRGLLSTVYTLDAAYTDLTGSTPLPQLQGGSLVSNGDFSDGLTGWTASNAVLSVVTEDGRVAVKVDDDGAYSQARQVIDTVAGRLMRATLWTKRKDGGSQLAYFEVYDGDSAPADDADITTVPFSEDSYGWVQHTVNFTPLSDKTTIAVRSNASEYAFFSDIRVEEIGGSSVALLLDIGQLGGKSVPGYISSADELVTNGDGSDGTVGWFGDDDTVISNVDGRIRGTLSGDNNPRIVQQIDGLTVGAVYEIEFEAYSPAVSNAIYYRVSNLPVLDASGPLDTLNGTTKYRTIFVAQQPTQYVGCVIISSGAGTYVEIARASVKHLPTTLASQSVVANRPIRQRIDGVDWLYFNGSNKELGIPQDLANPYQYMGAGMMGSDVNFIIAYGSDITDFVGFAAAGSYTVVDLASASLAGVSVYVNGQRILNRGDLSDVLSSNEPCWVEFIGDLSALGDVIYFGARPSYEYSGFLTPPIMRQTVPTASELRQIQSVMMKKYKVQP